MLWVSFVCLCGFTLHFFCVSIYCRSASTCMCNLIQKCVFVCVGCVGQLLMMLSCQGVSFLMRGGRLMGSLVGLLLLGLETRSQQDAHTITSSTYVEFQLLCSTLTLVRCREQKSQLYQDDWWKFSMESETAGLKACCAVMFISSPSDTMYWFDFTETQSYKWACSAQSIFLIKTSQNINSLDLLNHQTWNCLLYLFF